MSQMTAVQARKPAQSTPASSGGVLQRKCDKCPKKEKILWRSVLSSASEIVQPILHEALRSPGQPLDAETRSFMEPRFGHDFSRVRVHTDTVASNLSRALRASAFTAGSDIFFQDGHYNVATSTGRTLLAHELTHVVQQNKDRAGRKLVFGPPGDSFEQEAELTSQSLGHSHRRVSKEVRQTQDVPAIQKRLVAFGTLPDVNALLGLLGPRAGLNLRLNVADNQVQIAAVLPAAPPSPALRAQLTAIIGHATQHAEVIIGRGQPGVNVGAFPQPSDLTVTRVQQIDIDDIQKIESQAPGSGVALAAHEIQENFDAHAAVPATGVTLFPGSHRAAIGTESAVAEELVGPGRRVAEVIVNLAAGRDRVILDYENYYLVWRTRQEAATANVAITSARRRNKIVISSRTINNFGERSFFAPLAGTAVPAGGPGMVALAVADINANPAATVRVEGFADDSELLGGLTSTGRAIEVESLLIAAGVARTRIHAVGRGRTNFAFANDTPAHRALNRRVVITVTRPGP